MKPPCIHGTSRMVNARNGGRFCSACWNSKKGSSRLHDEKRNPSSACVEHGPHYVIESFDGTEFCLLGRGTLFKRCADSTCKHCNSCSMCNKEKKKEAKIDELELITRPDYQETSDKLTDIGNFTRIKDAAQG